MKRVILIVVLVSVASSAITGSVSGLLIKGNIDAGTATAERKLHKAQVNGCFRQNARQVALNKNALATWRLNTLFAHALTAKPARRQSRARRALTRAFRNRLLDSVATLSWTPLNLRCAKSPTTVLLPVAFSARQPSLSDLRLK